MISYLRNNLRAFHREEGQDLTEYGMLALLVAVALVAATTAFGETLGLYWSELIARLPI